MKEYFVEIIIHNPNMSNKEKAERLNALGYCYETYGWNAVINGYHYLWDEEKRDLSEEPTEAARLSNENDEDFGGDFWYWQDVQEGDVETLKKVYPLPSALEMAKMFDWYVEYCPHCAYGEGYYLVSCNKEYPYNSGQFYTKETSGEELLHDFAWCFKTEED